MKNIRKVVTIDNQKVVINEEHKIDNTEKNY